MITKPGFGKPPLEAKKERLNSPAAEQFVTQGRVEQPEPPSMSVKERKVPFRRSDMLWIDADPRYKQSVLFKVPEPEYMMLKALAGTTLGASQQSILLEALRDKMATMLEDRGLTVTRGENGTLMVRQGDGPELEVPS